MREIRYGYNIGGKQTQEKADFYIKNQRWVRDSTNNFVFKNTDYWIELKVESPAAQGDKTYGTFGAKDFGGKTPRDARKEDVAKLLEQKDLDKSKHPVTSAGERRRYWFVMLAFSNERRALLKSWAGEWTINEEYMHKDGNMLVCLVEV